MSDRMEIRESETGVIRVFHLDLPNEAIERYTVQAGTGEWPLMYGLGAKKLSAAFIDIVDIRDLGGMALSSYLHQAHNIAEEDLAGSKAQLDRLRGHVLILPSQAFARTAQTITARTPLRWIGSFDATKPKTMAPPLRSKGAKGGRSAPQPKKPVSPDMELKTKILIGLSIIIAAILVALVL